MGYSFGNAGASLYCSLECCLKRVGGDYSLQSSLPRGFVRVRHGFSAAQNPCNLASEKSKRDVSARVDDGVVGVISVDYIVVARGDEEVVELHPALGTLAGGFSVDNVLGSGGEAIGVVVH